MKSARAKRLAVSLGVLAGILLSVSVVLLFVNEFSTLMAFNHPDGGYEFSFVEAFAATFPEAGRSNIYLLGVNITLAAMFTPMGVFLAARQPKNALGWLFCVVGVLVGILAVADQYAVFAYFTSPGMFGGAWAAWVASWIWMPTMNLTFVLLPLFFPNGRLPSRRWKVLLWLLAGQTVLIVAYLAFVPGSITGGDPRISNPLGVDGSSRILELSLGVGAFVGWVCVFVAAISVVVRLRRASGIERQQIKWFAFAAAMVAFALLAGTLVRGILGFDVVGTLLQFAALPLFPLAIAAAILRYRLYDIDIIINKTIVYIALTASLAAVYLGLVVASEYVLQILIGEGSQIAVVASTLAIAALFNPFRRRIQNFVDLRFYRRRYDARETLADFSARLRDETDLDGLADDLIAVVGKTFRPAHASLWLRTMDEKTSKKFSEGGVS